MMRKFFFVFLGHLFLALGFIGIFLPILPTTPFVLLACGCYAKGSERLHSALLSNKVFGPYIKDWNDHRIIPLHAKIIASAMILTSMTWSLIVLPILWVKICLLITGLSVTFYIISRPSQKNA